MANPLMKDLALAAKAANDKQKKAIDDHVKAQTASNEEAIASEEKRCAAKKAELNAAKDLHFSNESTAIAQSKESTSTSVAEILGVTPGEGDPAVNNTILGIYDISVKDGATLASTIDEKEKEQTKKVSDRVELLGNVDEDFVL